MNVKVVGFFEGKKPQTKVMKSKNFSENLFFCQQPLFSAFGVIGVTPRRNQTVITDTYFWPVTKITKEFHIDEAILKN